MIATNEVILPVQSNVKKCLRGEGLPNLDSVSLCLRKMVQVGQRVSDSELKRVCAVAERNKEILNSFPPPVFSVPGTVSFTLRLGGRMMVDQAGGVLENANLCLHRNFGFPYISGSALKGIARHAAWCKWMNAVEAENLAEAKTLAWSIAATFGYPTGDAFSPKNEKCTREPGKHLDSFLCREFPADFGASGKKITLSGAVSFLPGYPADRNWTLVVDVLNSHRGSDTANPIPVFFPAVDRGASFRFAVTPIAGRSTPEVLNFAVEMLKCGLTENGVGAKTAAGYGWFDPSSFEKILDRASCSAEELKATYQDEVNALPYTGLENAIDSLNSRDEIFQRLYLSRLMHEKASLLRKWEKKGNPHLKTIQAIARKINLELAY